MVAGRLGVLCSLAFLFRSISSFTIPSCCALLSWDSLEPRALPCAISLLTRVALTKQISDPILADSLTAIVLGSGGSELSFQWLPVKWSTVHDDDATHVVVLFSARWRWWWIAIYCKIAWFCSLRTDSGWMLNHWFHPLAMFVFLFRTRLLSGRGNDYHLLCVTWYCQFLRLAASANNIAFKMNGKTDRKNIYERKAWLPVSVGVIRFFNKNVIFEHGNIKTRLVHGGQGRVLLCSQESWTHGHSGTRL